MLIHVVAAATMAWLATVAIRMTTPCTHGSDQDSIASPTMQSTAALELTSALATSMPRAANLVRCTKPHRIAPTIRPALVAITRMCRVPLSSA